MELKEKEYTMENKTPQYWAQNRDVDNATDARKDLFGQIHITENQSFKQTAGTAVWNTERDDPQ